jgi:hypothetical protein
VSETKPAVGISIGELETVYDVLAEAIDEAGEKADLFLVKLALMNANALGSAAVFQSHVQAALKHLTS